MLNIKENGIYVDATFGGGGHSREILKENDTIRLFAFDQDSDAIEKNIEQFSEYKDRFECINDNFSNFRSQLALRRVNQVDGILFDLGISNYQIRTGERGLSFDLDGALDMRMNQKDGVSAFEVVNNYSVTELAKIFRDFGEEREAGRIAKAIELERKGGEIRTTSHLSEVIDKSVLSHLKIKAKARVFQALRIYINRELDVLKEALADTVELLKPEGRLVVISYHSLEDRIVKQFIRHQATACVCPPRMPKCVCGKKVRLKIITKKPLMATEEECKENPCQSLTFLKSPADSP